MIKTGSPYSLTAYTANNASPTELIVSANIKSTPSSLAHLAYSLNISNTNLWELVSSNKYTVEFDISPHTKQCSFPGWFLTSNASLRAYLFTYSNDNSFSFPITFNFGSFT